MKKIGILFTIVSLVSLLITTESLAQRGMKWRGSGGWGIESQYGRMYDPKTVESFSGEVMIVDKITPRKGMFYGVHLMLKTEKETISIHLGPGWYIENQDIKIEPKDKIEVKGSRITFEGKPVIVVSEIKKGNELLKLRDENGFPVWSGWKRH